MEYATSSQSKWLQKFGYSEDEIYDMTKREASDILTKEFKRLDDEKKSGGGSSPGRDRPRGGGNSPAADRGRGRPRGGESDRGSRRSPPGGRERGQRRPPQGAGRSGSKGPTSKQAEILKDFGYDPADYTFETARELISRIADNNWEPLEEAAPPARDERVDSYGSDEYDPEAAFYDDEPRADDDIPF